jgi:hypothetical protein
VRDPADAHALERLRAAAKPPIPITHSAGRSRPAEALHAGNSGRAVPGGLSAWLRPLASMNAAGGSRQCSAKKSSGSPKRRASVPQKRVPLTSLRGQANPSTGRFGCSRAGLPIGASMPSQSRTIGTSPNGTPVCAIPNGPGFIQQHPGVGAALT